MYPPHFPELIHLFCALRDPASESPLMEALNHSMASKPFFHKPPLLHSNFNRATFFSRRCSHFDYSSKKRPSSFTTTTCRLKSPQDNKKSQSNVTKKIILSEGAPPPLAEEGGGPAGNKNGVLGFAKRFPRKVLAVMSNLPLAIGEMFAVAALMALGNVESQNSNPLSF